MENKERQNLANKSVLAAIYYLEQDEVTESEHEKTKNQLLKTISRRNIAVFDSKNQRFTGDMLSDSNITTTFIQRVRNATSAGFSNKDFFYHGLHYLDNQGEFVVITRESKSAFNEQMFSLLKILIIVSLLGLVLIYLFSRYLGNIAYDPVNRIVDQIKTRDRDSFYEPLKEERSYAEIHDLIATYNRFIDRLAQNFQIQKNFIDYVSHELRTPITAILGTLEVTETKDRSPEEYRTVLHNLKQYSLDLNEALDQMMILSGAKKSFDFISTRLDEIVWEVVEHAILYHEAKINVQINVQDVDLMEIQADSKLLELALNNLVGNAIKYSNNRPIQIELFEDNEQLALSIKDEGIGILKEDMEKIKLNFYRGQNSKDYQGKGIGLSMAHIIFSIHKIEMSLEENKPYGTVVILKFPNSNRILI